MLTMTNIQSSKMHKKTRTKSIKIYPHPVDSGWSWIVLLATFTVFVTFGGILRSFGIYMVEFLTVYSTDSTSTTLIIGLQFACSGIGALLSTTVGFQFFSPRQLIISGGLIGSIGLMMNTFANSIYFFIFSHSILVGMAIGLMNGTCLFSLGKYFDKHKSLANGVTISGVSLGGLIMGPVSRYLIDKYGLKGAFLVIGGIHLQTVVAGALIRPETFYQVVRKKRKRKISDHKSPERNVDQRARKISDSRKPEAISLLDDKNEQLDGFRPRIPTGDSFSPLARQAMLQRMRSRTESEVVTNDDILQGIYDKSNTVSNSHGDIPSKLHGKNKNKHCYISNEFLFDVSTVEIIRSVHAEHEEKDINSVNSSSTVAKKNSLKTYMHALFDCSIFRNIAFTIFLISYLAGSIGCFYPIVFIPALADFNGISKTQQSLLISICSAVDIFGRAGSGLFADRGIIGRKQIMIIAFCICGIANCLNSFYTTFWSLTVFSVIYGVIGGTVFAINSSTLSEIVTGEQFGQAVALMVGMQQITLGIAGPLTGALRDLTGTYSSTFYFIGAGNLFAACFLTIDILYIHFKKKTNTTAQVVNLELGADGK